MQRDHVPITSPMCKGRSPAVRDSDKLRSNTAAPSAVMPHMVASWGILARQETQSLLERMGHPLADRMWSPGWRWPARGPSWWTCLHTGSCHQE